MTCECGQPLADFHDAFTRGLCADCYRTTHVVTSYDEVQRLIASLETQANTHGGKQCAFCGTPLGLIEGNHYHDVSVPRVARTAWIMGKPYQWVRVDGQLRLQIEWPTP